MSSDYTLARCDGCRAHFPRYGGSTATRCGLCSGQPWSDPCTCPAVTDEAGRRLHLLACALNPIARSIHDEEVQSFRERTVPEWVRRARANALPSNVRSSWE